MPATENGAETILRACPDCAVTAGRRHDNKRNMPIGIGKETKQYESKTKRISKRNEAGIAPIKRPVAAGVPVCFDSGVRFDIKTVCSIKDRHFCRYDRKTVRKRLCGKGV
jgi:hypothetical protein